MIKQISSCILFILLLLCLLSCEQPFVLDNFPTIKNGVINFTQWDFTNNKLVSLTGNVRFKWMKDDITFKEPDYDDSDWDYTEFPVLWDYMGLPSTGYCWIRFTILHTDSEPLSLYLCYANTAYAFYINGEHVMSNGVPGNNAETATGERYRRIITLPRGETSVCAMKISNYSIRRGGMDNMMHIASLDGITYFTSFGPAMYSLLIGLLIFLSIYFLLLWIFRKEDKSSLYFFIFYIFLIIEFLSEAGLLEMAIPSYNCFHLAIFLEYISFYICIGILPICFASLFPEEFPKLLNIIFLTIMIIIPCLSPFVPGSMGLPYLTLRNFSMAFIWVYCSVHLTRAVLKKRRYAGILLSGFIIGFIGAVNDYLLPVVGIKISYSFSSYSLITWVLTQTIVITKRFIAAFQKAHYLSLHLQDEVKRKTIQIEEQHKKILEEQELKHKESLLHADKLISLGTLLASVAHEINNPNSSNIIASDILVRVWKHIAIILDRYADEHGDFSLGLSSYQVLKDELSDSIHQFYSNSMHIKDIVHNIKQFSKKKERDGFLSMDINECVEDSIRLVRHKIKQTTDAFSVRLREHIPYIMGDYHQLKQVMVNLLLNACAALTDTHEGIIVATKFNEATHEVLIRIRDEGRGMDEETYKNIFTPFYTTKQMQGGTGLGLFISLNIVRLHQGQLTVTSREGKGTTVDVILPLQKKAAAREKEPSEVLS